MEFRIAPFYDIPLDTFYDILRLRSEVFVVEQTCYYLDIDGIDKKAHHVWVEDNGQIIACARIMQAGISYPEAALGRVAVHADYRNKGLGRTLMLQTLHHLYALHGVQPVRIMAQAYLQKFYESLGFQVCSDAFDDFGIMHYYMIKQP